MTELLLIGASGLAREVLACVRENGQFDVVGVLDDDESRVGSTLDGAPILGPASHALRSRRRRIPAARTRGSAAARRRCRRRRLSTRIAPPATSGSTRSASGHRGTERAGSSTGASDAGGAVAGPVGCGEKSRNRPVPRARTASAESAANEYGAENVPRPGVGSNGSHPYPANHASTHACAW
jgi:hypothetical protein